MSSATFTTLTRDSLDLTCVKLFTSNKLRYLFGRWRLSIERMP